MREKLKYSMYKSKVLISVLSLFVFLSLFGCFGSADTPTDSSNDKSYQGEISELATSIGGLDVTHVLITQAKDRVYLRSILFDLDEYINQSVRVYGTYYEEKVSGSPVDVLTVNQIDILGDASNSAELQTYSSENLGIEFVYDAHLFEIKDSVTASLSLSNAGSGVDSINFKVFRASPELDAELYIDKTFPNENFSLINEVTEIANLKGFTNYDDTDVNKTVFVFTFSQYVYVVSTYSSSDEILQAMVTTLDSVNYIGSPKSKLQDLPDSAEDISSDDQGDTNSESTEIKNGSKAVNSQFQSVIDRYLVTFKSGTPVSFSFTDNGYFYLIFQDVNGKSGRSLVKYSDTNFQTVAEFVSGDKETWKLVSGENLVYDRPQTLIMVNGENGAREVAVKQGYRYFESLPLGFGLQYPQNWYYTRVENSYNFSNKPLDESATLITVKVLTGNLTLPSTQNENGKIVYNVKVKGGFVSVSGPQAVESVVRAMAETIVDLAN